MLFEPPVRPGCGSAHQEPTPVATATATVTATTTTATTTATATEYGRPAPLLPLGVMELVLASPATVERACARLVSVGLDAPVRCAHELLALERAPVEERAFKARSVVLEFLASEVGVTAALVAKETRSALVAADRDVRSGGATAKLLRAARLDIVDALSRSRIVVRALVE